MNSCYFKGNLVEPEWMMVWPDLLRQADLLKQQMEAMAYFN